MRERGEGKRGGKKPAESRGLRGFRHEARDYLEAVPGADRIESNIPRTLTCSCDYARPVLGLWLLSYLIDAISTGLVIHVCM